MIHVYHGDGKGKTTAAMGLALRMLAAGRRVVVVQFLKDGESGEVRLLAEHFGVPVFAGKASDKFTWSMTSEELAATCELHDGNLASALAELEGAQEGLLVLDEALDALSKGLVDEALVDRALDMSARGVEVALTGRAPSRKIVEKADYITEMRCEQHPYEQGKEWSTRWIPRRWRPATSSGAASRSSPKSSAAARSRRSKSPS